MLVPQKQDNKGFSILELMVVLAIVAVVSAMAFPNFSSWKADRELRSAAEKIANLITNINTQSQRGAYPYVQVKITPYTTACGMNTCVNSSYLSLGMKQNTLSSKINAGGLTALDCPRTNTGVGDWDDEVLNMDLPNIATHLPSAGEVCFSKDGGYYETEGSISGNQNVSIESRTSPQYLIICSSDQATNNKNVCPIDLAEGLEKPAYLIEWSRFGNVAKFKWSGSEWNRQ